jgi:hypothetical protein
LSRAALLAALLALLAGCGPSPAEKRDLARRTLQSWTATLRKTSDALHNGTVPRVYARQVVQAAIESKNQESTEPEWETLPALERADLERAIQQLAAALGEPLPDASR